MTKQTETPKAEPALRELSPAEMQQAGGGIIIAPERRGTSSIVIHE